MSASNQQSPEKEGLKASDDSPENPKLISVTEVENGLPASLPVEQHRYTLGSTLRLKHLDTSVKSLGRKSNIRLYDSSFKTQDERASLQSNGDAGHQRNVSNALPSAAND